MTWYVLEYFERLRAPDHQFRVYVTAHSAADALLCEEHQWKAFSSNSPALIRIACVASPPVSLKENEYVRTPRTGHLIQNPWQAQLEQSGVV